MFSLIERFLLKLSSAIILKKKYQKTVVVFSSRPGRGLVESHVDSEWFTSIPEKIREDFRFLKYNNKIWIFDCFKLLYALATASEMKLVLFSYAPKFHKFPSLALLNHLEKNNAQIIKVWLDSWNEQIWDKRILPVSKVGSYNILFDQMNDLSRLKDPLGKYFQKLPSHTPIPFIDFQSRENFLFYSGSISSGGSYKPRKEHLDWLKFNGVKVVGVATDRQAKNFSPRPTYEQYRWQLGNSKVGLNFTWKHETHVVTYRTWDILSSGVLLLQNESNVIKDFFIAGKHYLAFNSKQELLEIILDLSQNQNKIEQIALAGMAQYKKIMENNDLWNQIYNNQVK
jgi:hypothetical protein